MLVNSTELIDRGDMRKLRVALVGSALVALLLGGCQTPRTADAGSARDAAVSSSPDGYGRGSVVPPEDVPHATAGGTHLQPNAYAWRVKGKLVTLAPKDDASIVVNELAPDQAPLVLDVDARAQPSRANLATFRLSEPGGFPADEEGPAVDCAKPQQTCSIAPSPDGGLRVSTGVVVDPHTFVLLVLEYGSREDDQADARFPRVSWLIRQRVAD